MTKMMSYRNALVTAVTSEMEADPNVFVFGLDVPDHKRIFGSTAGLVEKFGSKRCFGTPLSEEAMTGIALGAAMSGLKPIHVHIRSDFMLLATNQIINMVSNVRYLSGGRLSVPLVIRAIIGRGWGQGAQHSKSLHSLFAHIPGLKVVMPSTPQDAYSLLRAAIQDPNPVIFLEQRWLYDIEGPVDLNLNEKLGHAAVKKEGKDVTIISTSWMTVEALKVAEVLNKKQGIDAEIIDARSIAPLDEKTIYKSVRKTGRAVVLDYDWVYCGFASEIAASISEHCFDVLKKPVLRFGFEHVPCPTTRPLENLFFPAAPKVIRAIENMFRKAPSDFKDEYFFSYDNKFKGPF